MKHRAAWLFAFCSVFSAPPLSAGEPAAAWQKLKARLADASGDRAKLRDDVLAFRRSFPGTPQFYQAAAGLRDLPSPLDKLDPAKIPVLERYDWQPKDLVAVLGEQRGRHGAVVYSVAFSPNGKYLASGGSTFVRVWDALTMRQIALLGTGGGGVYLTWAKDSSLLVAGDGGGSIRIWDATNEKFPSKFVIPNSSTAVSGVAISPDGTNVAATSADLITHLWDITGKEAKPLPGVGGHEKAPTAVVYSPSGKTLATAGNDGTVRLWDMAAGKPTAKAVLQGHPKEVNSLAFHHDGTLLASGGYDGTLCVWSISNTKAPRNFLKGSWGVVYSLAFSGSGKRLAAATGDGLIHQWEVGNALKERIAGTGHQGPVYGVAFPPKGDMLASGGHDNTARLWNLSGAKPVEKFKYHGHLSWVYATAFSPDGFTLASGSLDTTQRWWNLSGLEPKEKTLPKLADPMHIYSLSYAPDGKTIAAAGNSVDARLYETTQGREIRRLKHEGAVGLVSFSPDGKRLASIYLKTLHLWDSANPGPPRKLVGHTTNIISAAWSSDSKWLLTGAGNYEYKNNIIVLVKGVAQYTDCTLRLWDPGSGTQADMAKNFDKPIYAVAQVPGSQKVFTTTYPGLVRQWDIEGDKLKEATWPKGPDGHIALAQVSPDGRLLVTRGPAHSLQLWEVATGKALTHWDIPEHIGGVAFAQDNRHLAVGLGNGPVYILRLASLRTS